ncbi:mitochondrial genome maintenance exonuclease 1-like [Dermacentor andersoni]|uniref:mitochondrial genome maintenance exonuclease 1-like n=1 Tax=Dermacentor andersoni TaxID=34620 RepID=UPI00215575F0|nr:mitochondrial genome maintenance exonuclease 1-like [Dermacentor andersoni]
MMAAAMAANFVVCKSFARHSALVRDTACKCMKATKATKTPVTASEGDAKARATKKPASAAKAVKKFNFENFSLYGPVLKSTKGTKLDKGLRLSYLDERAPRRMKTSRLACEERETARIARAGERVYRIQLEAELLDALTATDDETARLEAASEDAEQRVNISVPTKSFDLEATLNFPLLNFLRDGVPDDDNDASGEEVVATTPQDAAQDCRKTTKYPSVTTILKDTMDEQSRFRLEQWKQKMVAEMGAESFKKYQESILSQGKSLHVNIRDLLGGTPKEEIVVQPENEGHWRSLESFWPEIGKVAHLESTVCHPHLQYRGILDCVAVCRDELVLIDWKTSKKPKPLLSDTYDNPLQVAAYIGALNYDDNYKIQVRDAMIVIAYEDGSPCQVHHLGPALCQRHWQRWLQRLRTYWNRLHQDEMMFG